MTRIKVCCITSEREGMLAVEHGADLIGLVSDMPSGPGIISEDLIARIARTIKDRAETVLLTSKTDAADIVAQQRQCQVRTLQLCESVSPAVYAELRQSLPEVKLVQVVHVLSREALQHAAQANEYVDAILLDTGSRSESLTELGGTGRTHDWSISAEIVRQSTIPVFLAGGLHADNVKEAIQTVGPDGVDACSGLREEGALDEQKLVDFIAAVQAAAS